MRIFSLGEKSLFLRRLLSILAPGIGDRTISFPGALSVSKNEGV
jgi:hypothetical protein